MQALKSFVVMCAAGAVLSLSGPGPAAAQDAVMMGKNASECEIAAGLGVAKPGCPTPGGQHKKPGTRGLAIGNVDAMPAPPPAAAPKQEYTAAFQINFEFGSARLTPDAQQMLDKIGSVLGDASSAKFRIAGHTDGVGSPSRNQKLSAERAEAVKDYLAGHFSIQAARLQAVGKGSRELLNKADPSAAENRRVEITNLGG